MKSFSDYEIKVCNSPEEIRAELFRLRHFEPLVRSCLDAADYTGLSAEDKYTTLAFHAIVRMKYLQDLCLEYNSVQIPSRMVI